MPGIGAVIHEIGVEIGVEICWHWNSFYEIKRDFAWLNQSMAIKACLSVCVSDKQNIDCYIIYYWLLI